MRCVVCDANDWENVDQYRIRKEGMALCKSCGMISYPAKWKTIDEIKAYYKKDYRNPPTVRNWFTGQRKLHYHNAFLTDLFVEWKNENKKPVVCEIGAAYGLFLNFFRNHFPDAELHGTEWTISYRRNAWHEFGINLTDDVDTSKQYDLIASYKVAEHQVDVDLMLRQYVECLKPGGYLYISVPTWLSRLTNFGAAGFDLEYYYHPNHINVWTKKLFEQILKKVGLKIVKHNDTYYDDTYLCVRDDEQMKLPLEKEDPAEIKSRLAQVHAAGVHFMEGRFTEAVQTWPDFPEAHVNRYETKRAEFHKQGFDVIREQVIDLIHKCCPNSPEAWGLTADIHIRYDHFEDALKCLEKNLQLRPGNPTALRMMAQCYRALRHKALLNEDIKLSRKYLNEARNVSRHLAMVSDEDRWSCLTAIYDDNAKLPTPHEMQN